MLMRWSRLTGFSLVLIATQAMVGCSDDGDDVPGATAGSAGKGGSSTAGTGGKSTAGSNSTAGKGGTFGTAGDTSTAGGGTDGGGMAGTGGMMPEPDCTQDEDCTDDANVCTTAKCVDEKCVQENNTEACDDENECTDDDTCDAGACKGTNNTANCDDNNSCTPGQDKCAEGKCSGTKDEVLCPKCDVPENIIKNCDFTKGADGLEDWSPFLTNGGGQATQTVINEVNVINVTSGGGHTYEVQPRQEPIKLKQGMNYELRMLAGSDKDRTIWVSLTKGAPPYTGYSGGPVVGDDDKVGYPFALTKDLKPFGFSFLMKGAVAEAGATPMGDEEAAKLEIKVGGADVDAPNKVYFDDVFLTEVKCTDATNCDDGNSCTTDACDTNTGLCSWTPVGDGDACAADADACTDDVCNAGACTHPTSADGTACTDDEDECTADECTAGVCGHTFDNAVCECQTDAHCDDGEPCTNDTCDVATGTCTTAPNTGATCDDGNVCTSDDTCAAGVCEPGTNNTAACTDTDICTVNNMCGGGTCGAGTNVCFDCTAGGNLVTNCNFSEAGIAGWEGSYIANPANATLINQNGMLNVVITGSDDADYKIQPLFQFITLTEGVQYEVKFNAYSTIARKAKFTISRANADYSTYFPEGPIEINLTTEMQQFSFIYTQPATPQTAKFEFDLGGADYNPTVPNTVFIDNVFIAPKL
jgi:hypothetical protein